MFAGEGLPQEQAEKVAPDFHTLLHVLEEGLRSLEPEVVKESSVTPDLISSKDQPH